MYDFSALLAILIQRYIQELPFSNQNLAKKNLFLVVKYQVTPSAESHFTDDDYGETTITESLLCARHCTGHFPYVIKNHYYGAWTMSLDTVLLHWVCVSKRFLPTLPGSPGCCEANKWVTANRNNSNYTVTELACVCRILIDLCHHEEAD